jgi:hypothetical protein
MMGDTIPVEQDDSYEEMAGTGPSLAGASG